MSQSKNITLEVQSLTSETKLSEPKVQQILQPPKGFRDFLPAQKRARDYVQAHIKKTFERFCFEPLETPTL